jgi:prefoldin subunit 5
MDKDSLEQKINELTTRIVELEELVEDLQKDIKKLKTVKETSIHTKREKTFLKD